MVDLRLHRIADVLLLNGSFTDNPGLLNGKMGIAIFMYNYARKTGLEVYEKCACELIDDIYGEINTKTPVDFADGLAGIGWGVAYLVRNGFVQADADEVLSDIDKAVSRTIYKESILHEKNDLSGLGFYCLCRLNGKEPFRNIPDSELKKNNIIQLIEENERFTRAEEKADFNISQLNRGTINSIIWFLLEIHKLISFKTKAHELLLNLLSEPELVLGPSDDPVEELVLCKLIQNSIPLISGAVLKEKYTSYANLITGRWNELNIGDDKLEEIFSSLILYRLIYDPYLMDIKFLTQLRKKVFNNINKEENWSNLLDKLNKDNIGIKGLAGIGLGLMYEQFSNFQIHEFSN